MQMAPSVCSIPSLASPIPTVRPPSSRLRQITCRRNYVNFQREVPHFRRRRSSICSTTATTAVHSRKTLCVVCSALQAETDKSVVLDMERNDDFKGDFTARISARDNEEIKIEITASGKMTCSVFEEVFSKMVEAAQPIPGFRRVKGGKTPDVPKEVLLQILGQSNVNKEAIKKIINRAVAKFVDKEQLDISNDLKVEQTFGELEAAFVPGKDLVINVVAKLNGSDRR